MGLFCLSPACPQARGPRPKAKPRTVRTVLRAARVAQAASRRTASPAAHRRLPASERLEDFGAGQEQARVNDHRVLVARAATGRRLEGIERDVDVAGRTTRCRRGDRALCFDPFRRPSASTTGISATETIAVVGGDDGDDSNLHDAVPGVRLTDTLDDGAGGPSALPKRTAGLPFGLPGPGRQVVRTSSRVRTDCRSEVESDAI
jgi:hypothetical protein